MIWYNKCLAYQYLLRSYPRILIVSVHQPHYLPWLGYLDKIDQSDLFVILDNVQFKKREFQNRNRIKTPGGDLWLTVPVVTRGKYEQKTSEVEIDNSTPWREKHLKSLEMNYRKAPFYNDVMGKIEKFYTGTAHERLMDLCTDMLKCYMEMMGISTPVRFESELNVPGVKSERIVNICKALGAGVYLSGSGAKAYLDEELFEKEGLGLEYQHYKHPEYGQLHGDFSPYMAAVDLLFNHGAASREIMIQGRVGK